MAQIDRAGLLRKLSAVVDDFTRVVEGVELETDQWSNLEHNRLTVAIEQARQQGLRRLEGIVSYLFLPACKEEMEVRGEPRYWVEIVFHADL